MLIFLVRSPLEVAHLTRLWPVISLLDFGRSSLTLCSLIRICTGLLELVRFYSSFTGHTRLWPDLLDLVRSSSTWFRYYFTRRWPRYSTILRATSFGLARRSPNLLEFVPDSLELVFLCSTLTAFYSSFSDRTQVLSNFTRSSPGLLELIRPYSSMPFSLDIHPVLLELLRLTRHARSYSSLPALLEFAPFCSTFIRSYSTFIRPYSNLSGHTRVL